MFSFRRSVPLDKPWNDLATNAHSRDLEKPNTMLEAMVHMRPSIIAGLRPIRSESQPQDIPVRHCDIEKTADMSPAYFATCSVGTLKDWTISGCKHQSGDLFNVAEATHQVGKDRGHRHGLRKSTHRQHQQLLRRQPWWWFPFFGHSAQRAGCSINSTECGTVQG